MLKITFLILIEVVVGLAIAGALLAIAVPVLVRNELLTPGDVRGVLLVFLVLVVCVGGAVFRPGSTLNRWTKHWMND